MFTRIFSLARRNSGRVAGGFARPSIPLHLQPCTSGLRPTRHSAPRLSPGLRPPPLCRCAERHADLSQPALLVGIGYSSLHTDIAGSRGHWGGWCSEVKEEVRAQPGPGDMSGTIYPGAIGPHKPPRTNGPAQACPARIPTWLLESLSAQWQNSLQPIDAIEQALQHAHTHDTAPSN